MSFLPADWSAPDNVFAGVTTRCEGVSHTPYAYNNLAQHVGDDAQLVDVNRQTLDEQLPGKKTWQWLEQVHGVDVVKSPTGGVSVADACFTDKQNVVCTVLTADCLPILLCNKQGTEVAAIHAGWRSLCAGVIENTVSAMKTKPEDLISWFGPAIGPNKFEVGESVHQAFSQAHCGSESLAAFTPTEEHNKYYCDIYLLAIIRLRTIGINNISGGHSCTVTERDKYYSYRRKGVTGRMASFVYFL